MENFKFYNPAKIYFGKGQEELVGEIIKSISNNILFVYGKESIKKIGLYNKVTDSLSKNGITYIELPGIEGNPKLDKVREGIEICRNHKIDFILAVGGGSVIDTAKAIAVGVPYEGDVWDFYIKKATPTKALKIGTILTVVGAGSEMSNSSVITKEDEKLKRSFDNTIVIPYFSILDPELTYSVSKFQTACGSFDALSHLMERYFTLIKNNDTTDRMIEGLMKTIIYNAPIAINNPSDYNARAELMWASCLAQNGLLNTGRVGDWGCHAIEHELSGEYDIPHGEGLAMITTQWMKYVMNQDIYKFVQFAERVFSIEMDPCETKRIAEQGINMLSSFITSIGLENNTSTLKISEETAKKLSKRAVIHSKTRGRFLRMTDFDIYNIIINSEKSI